MVLVTGERESISKEHSVRVPPYQFWRFANLERCYTRKQ